MGKRDDGEVCPHPLHPHPNLTMLADANKRESELNQYLLWTLLIFCLHESYFVLFVCRQPRWELWSVGYCRGWEELVRKSLKWRTIKEICSSPSRNWWRHRIVRSFVIAWPNENFKSIACSILPSSSIVICSRPTEGYNQNYIIPGVASGYFHRGGGKRVQISEKMGRGGYLLKNSSVLTHL